MERWFLWWLPGWWWWCGKEEVVTGTEMVGVVVTTCSGVVERRWSWLLAAVCYLIGIGGYSRGGDGREVGDCMWWW